MASFEERVKRLEYRSREADNALKQLTAYANVLKQVAENSIEKPGAVLELEKENRQLNEEIQQLKQRLIDAEILNGRPHIANPAVIPTTISTESKPSTTTKLPPPPPSSSSVDTSPSNNSDSTKEQKGGAKEGGATAGKTTGKQNKQPKKEKGATGGGKVEGGATDKPIDVSRLDFKIGKIMTVKQHPDADGLYVEEIELGEERPRTVCSGLVKFIPIEQMQDHLVIVLCNLKPAKMRGVLSEAMVMCASTPEKVELLDPPANAVPGDRVTFEGYTGTPDAQLNPKKKIFEQIQPDLLTSSDGIATYKGIPFTVEGKGTCHSQTLNNTMIK